MTNGSIETATIGGGCFWCTEAVYLALKGVEEVVSGYSGGEAENPTYQEVCTGATGHAEVVQVKFDSDVISFKEVLQIFFATHDPTTLNRQGNDVGTQYRSAIFPLDDAQREEAQAAIARANEDHGGKVVTTIEGPATWYPAEDYHQEYWEGEGQRNPYCLAVIPPKLMKLRKSFATNARAD